PVYGISRIRFLSSSANGSGFCDAKSVPSTRGQRRLRPSWWQNFQAVFLCDSHHAGDVLLFLRSQPSNILEEPFEPRWGNDAHEPARGLAHVTVGMRYATRREIRITFLCNEFFSAHRPFIVPFQNLESLVLTMMNMRRRTAAEHIVRLHCAHNTASVTTVNA